jgi:hypothetical protein
MHAMERRNFLSRMAVAVAALSWRSPAGAQLVEQRSQWKFDEFEKLLHHPARIKQMFEETKIEAGGFLNNIKNSLNGLQVGFGVPAQEIKIVAALHGPPNMLNYDDYVWNKYKIGEWLRIDDPATGKLATRNPYYQSKAGKDLRYSSTDPNSSDSIFQDISIQGLQARGVQFLSCHTATEEQARKLAQERHLTQPAEEIVRDMNAHLLPHVLQVAAMGAAVALLQSEGHYTYTTV